MKYYLAIDIGASSGRHIIGWMENGALQNKEIYRFENKLVKQYGHLIWDVKELFHQIKEGIRRAFSAYGEIRSLSVDT